MDDLFNLVSEQKTECVLCRYEVREFEKNVKSRNPYMCLGCTTLCAYLDEYKKESCRVFVSDGQIYKDMAGNLAINKKRHHKGFGGRKFTILITQTMLAENIKHFISKNFQFLPDGGEFKASFVTDDLYLCGRIPDAILENFPDNCKIIGQPFFESNPTIKYCEETE